MTLKFSAASHRYWLDGKPVKGVTTLLGALNKPALPYWAAKTVAEYVADNLDDLESWGRMERESLVAALKQVPWSQRDRAGVRGTDIHELAEKIVNGHEVEVPDLLLGPVNGYVEFLEDFQATPVVTEVSLANRTIGYAGRVDFIGEITVDGVRQMWALDWKTSKSVYGDTALQVAAYAKAEFYVTDDDPNTEHDLPKVERIGVVHITESGAFLHELGDLEDAFEEFRCVAALAKTTDRRKHLITDPIVPGRTAA